MIRYEQFQLNNGLKVFVHPDPYTPMAALSLTYDVGSKDEEADKTGFAHLFEHLMFRGSKNIPNYDQPLQEVGGENNAFTSSDLTNYHISLPAVNLETAFWLESDRMLGLDFQEEKLEAEKRVVIEEYKQNYLNQPYGDIWLNLYPMAYQVHPYQWPTIGKDIQHIENARLEDAQDFYSRFYCPNNAIMVVSGNVQLDQVQSLSQKWFEDIPTGPLSKRSLPAEPPQTESRRLDMRAEVPMDVLYLAFHMPSRRDPDYYGIDLLSDILGRGKTSRLYQVLVRDKSMCASIRAFISGSMDPGLFVIQAYANPGVHLEDIAEEIWKIIEDVSQNAVSKEELQKVKNKAESTIAFNEIELLSRTINLSYYATLGDIERINDESQLIQAVQIEDLQRLSKQLLQRHLSSSLYYRKK